MGLYIFNKGFNYSQDGKGNRLVYHLKGCNLKCPWCSNPEGMDFTADKALYVHNKDIMDEIMRSKPMFFDGGGVTFTGGEATCQFEDLKVILTELKKLNINTCIETNGTANRLIELMPLLDELIIDFKHYDNEIHKKVLGLDNNQIKNNLKQAFSNHNNLLVRIPLINGFNAEEKDILEFIKFFKQFDVRRTRFEFLSYHEYGKDKWKKCGKAYSVNDGFIKPEIKIEFEKIFYENGLNIVRT